MLSPLWNTPSSPHSPLAAGPQCPPPVPPSCFSPQLKESVPVLPGLGEASGALSLRKHLPWLITAVR